MGRKQQSRAGWKTEAAPRDGVGGDVCVCVCARTVKAPPLQPHVPLLAADRILPERTVCPSKLPYCLDTTRANWGKERERKMPSLWGLCLLPLGLSDTFILSFNNVSLPHCVCVVMHLRTDFSPSYILCVWGGRLWLCWRGWGQAVALCV